MLLYLVARDVPVLIATILVMCVVGGDRWLLWVSFVRLAVLVVLPCVFGVCGFFGFFDLFCLC